MSLVDNIPVFETVDPDQKHYDTLVGDGKKFADNEALARSKLESDIHIRRIEREMKELREDLARKAAEAETTKRLEELVGQMTNPRPPVSPSNEPTIVRQEDRQESITPEKLEEMLLQRERKRTRESNLNEVKQTLVSRFGQDYPAKLKEIADDLKVGVNFLDNVAAENPRAFLKMIGSEEKPVDPVVTDFSFAPPRNRVTTPLSPATNDRTWGWYENLRKTDPVKYNTVKVSNEMMEDALRLKESFYK